MPAQASHLLPPAWFAMAFKAFLRESPTDLFSLAERGCFAWRTTSIADEPANRPAASVRRHWYFIF
jgi:hypothetical protein